MTFTNPTNISASTTMAAVEVRGAYKYYGSKSKSNIILNNLNMRVEPGTIYGLLGASGCGKTTLLSCLVGYRQLNSGEVRVLGQKPGSPGLGARIGFMPQEVSLVDQMTIKESIYYFGRIYGMTSEKIYEKFHSIKKLLELPPSSKMIENCSGGQQRRISLACALVHDPELLILDEPTVGLDPILRERIWDFLFATTRLRKTAVIITTHYIEEAREAHCVGFMRNGVLLMEDTPKNILTQVQVNSLEDAFLKLSAKQGDKCKNSFDRIICEDQRQTTLIAEQATQTTVPNKSKENEMYKNTKTTPSWSIIKALLGKNFIKMFRNPTMLGFLILLPFISQCFFYWSVGKTLMNNRLGIVNTETTCNEFNITNVLPANDTCYLTNISCRFIKTIGSTDFIEPVIYHDVKEAYRDAMKTSIIGYIHIPRNFSTAMQARIDDGTFADNTTIEETIMETRLDMTAGQSVYYTELKLSEHFQNFIREIFRECGFPTKFASVPIVFNDPIYGSEDADFQQFMAPGIILSIVFFLNTIVTSNIFIDERTDGVWDRTLIAGASANHLLWSHLFTQFLLTIIQNVECVIFIGLVFRNKYQDFGSAMALIALLFLISTGGMFFGLVLSIYCKKHAEASYMNTGVFYVMVSVCGLMWPVEGMSKYLQKIVAFTPLTLPAISARNIVEKGWAITHNGVYKGYVVISVWIVIFYVLCLIGIKRKM